MKKLSIINNILFLIFLLIAIPSIFMSEFGSNITWGSKGEPEAILSNTEAVKLLNDKKRKSIISFQEMILIDSSKMIYIIPISQNELKKEQEVGIATDFYEKLPPNSVNTIFENIPGNVLSIPKSLTYGIYNNVVLKNCKESNEKVLFGNRASISSIKLLTINNEKCLAIRYSTEDTDKDGKLGFNDKQNISFFNLNGKEILKLKSNTYNLKEVLFSQDNKIFISTEDFELSKLASGNVMRIIEVDIKSGVQEMIIKKKTQDCIQDILDGKLEKIGAQEDNRKG